MVCGGDRTVWGQQAWGGGSSGLGLWGRAKDPGQVRSRTLSPAWHSARTSQGEWHSLDRGQSGPSRLSSRGEDFRVQGGPVLCEGGHKG